MRADLKYVFLWWIADNMDEAKQWRKELMQKGVNFVNCAHKSTKSTSRSPQVDVVFSVHKDRVEEVTGQTAEQQKVLDDLITIEDIMDNPNFMAIAQRIKAKETLALYHPMERKIRDQLIDLLEEISGYRYDSDSARLLKHY